MSAKHPIVLCSVPVLGALSMVCSASGGRVYVNDFSVRTSAEPIPALNVWHEATPYPSGNNPLCFRPSVGDGLASYGELSWRGAYYHKSIENGRPSIDGWFIPFFNYRDSYKLYSRTTGCGVATDGAYKHTPGIIFCDGDPGFTFYYGSATRRAGVVLQSLRNSFTNGQLRIQVDMRAPEGWESGYAFGRVFPVYDKYMDILAWNGSWNDRDEANNSYTSMLNSPVTPGKFGFRSTGGKISDENGRTRTYPQYYDVRNLNGGTTQVGNNYGTEFNYWHRFIVTYDLDNAKFGGEVYRIKESVGHPALDTEMTSGNLVAGKKTFSNALWQNCATNAAGVLTTDMAAFWREKGGISGIGIDTVGSYPNGNVTTNKIIVDNFRISWKAPDGDDFEVFYENDFTTRRYRTLSPKTHAASAPYSPSVSTTTAPRSYTYSVASDLQEARIVPRLDEISEEANPVGIDGWRVLPYEDVNGSSQGCHPGILKYGGNDYDKGEGGNVLTYGNQGSWSLIAQTLEASYTSGKVRLVADVRLPLGGLNTWHENTRRAAIGLGSAALYTEDSAGLAANLAAGAGYLRTVDFGDGVNVTNDVPYCLGRSVSAKTPSFTFGEDPSVPEKATWYRYDITADIDARTYDATITPIGTASVLPDFTLTNDAIYSVSSVPFAADVTDIGTFYLRGFGYGNANSASYINRRVCFDNIRVYHIAPPVEEGGEETSRLVYENDFTASTRDTGLERACASGYVADQYDRDDGQDGWIRRNGSGYAFSQATATVRDDDGNRFLALGREGESGENVHVTHTFGQYLRRPFRFRVDVRPPDAWGRRNGFVSFGLGSPLMEQTQLTEAEYNAGRMLSFGMSNTVADTYCEWHNPRTAAFASGDGEDTLLAGTGDVDASRWYRFAVTVRPELGTYSVRLFDMGTAHPECEGAEGTLVSSADGIPFLNEPGDEGIGVFHVHAKGVRGTVGVTGVDAGNVLVDNIVVSAIPGLVLSVR